LSLLCIL